MKKSVLTVAAFALALTTLTPAYAADINKTTAPNIIAPVSVSFDNYKLMVNDKTLDSKVYTVNNCAMVPARDVGEALGFTVTWNPDKKVTIDSGKMHSTVTIGKDYYVASTSIKGGVGMTAPCSLGAAPSIIDGSTYVPAQLFRILLGNSDDAVTINENQILIQSNQTDDNTFGAINPLTEHATVDELKKAVGFDFKVPVVPDGYTVSLIQDINKNVAEIRFSNGANTIHYRIGSENVDNSGVYNEYSSTNTCTVDDTQVTCKGNGDTVSLATWTKNGYGCSLYCEEGMTASQILDIVKSTF